MLHLAPAKSRSISTAIVINEAVEMLRLQHDVPNDFSEVLSSFYSRFTNGVETRSRVSTVAVVV